jgi:hypothetical protein
MNQVQLYNTSQLIPYFRSWNVLVICPPTLKKPPYIKSSPSKRLILLALAYCLVSLYLLIVRHGRRREFSERMSCDLLASQLYDICQAQNCTFLKIRNNNIILLFRRRLTPALLDRWTAVQQLARNVPVSDGAIWSLAELRQGRPGPWPAQLKQNLLTAR